MTIEIRKKTGLLGEIDYFVDINGLAVVCVSTLEEAEELFEKYKQSKGVIYETIKSETI